MISKQAFEASCQHWGIEAAEQQIASWVRQLSTPSGSTQRTLENTLLRLQLALAALDPAEPFVADGTNDLSTVLLARSLGNIGRQTRQDQEIYFSLAASAFAAAGNFATASVFARETIQTSESLGEFSRWILNILANPTKRFSEQAPRSLGVYAKLMDAALDSGLASKFVEARAELLQAFKQASDSLSPQDKYLALLWEKAHDRYTEFSAARVLREHGFENLSYFRQLRTTTSSTLFPTQVKAIAVHSLLENSRNALILLPTSTGKSLLGELALIKGLAGSSSKPLAVYLAPYRALADQLVRKMKPRLTGIGINCEVHRGGYLSNALSIISEKTPTILVATPEAFDSLVRTHPHLYSQIACCVFDEFHLIEQHFRGVSYEAHE